MSSKKKKGNVVPFQQQTNKQKWEELEALYASMAAGVFEISTQLAGSLAIIKESGIPESLELTSAVRVVTTDILAYTETLTKIHDGHKGRTGLVKDGDELVDCLRMFNDYVLLNDKFNAVVSIPMLSIADSLAMMETSSASKSVVDTDSATKAVEDE